MHTGTHVHPSVYIACVPLVYERAHINCNAKKPQEKADIDLWQI